MLAAAMEAYLLSPLNDALMRYSFVGFEPVSVKWQEGWVGG